MDPIDQAREILQSHIKQLSDLQIKFVLLVEEEQPGRALALHPDINRLAAIIEGMQAVLQPFGISEISNLMPEGYTNALNKALSQVSGN